MYLTRAVLPRCPGGVLSRVLSWRTAEIAARAASSGLAGRTERGKRGLALTEALVHDHGTAPTAVFDASWPCRAADGLRACARRHAIENGAGDGGLGLLSRKGARAQAPADQSLVSADGRLDQGASSVTGGGLPFQPSVIGNRPDVTISLARWSDCTALHRRHTWRNYNRCGEAVLQDGARFVLRPIRHLVLHLRYSVTPGGIVFEGHSAKIIAPFAISPAYRQIPKNDPCTNAAWSAILFFVLC